jgi:hypothetical protein
MDHDSWKYNLKNTSSAIKKLFFRLFSTKTNLMFGLITIAATALFVRNIYVLECEKTLPLFRKHDHFILDFEYFYDMGKQSVTAPVQLYSDPEHEGTPVLLLNRNVFHPYPPPAALFFRLFSLIPFKYSYALWSICIYGLVLLSLMIFTNCLKTEFHIGKKTMGFPFILCLSAAPSFLDASFGNVNSVVLLLCVVFVWLFNRQRLFSAGIVLSFAFWMKLYPALLMLSLIKTNKKTSLIYGFSIGAAVIPAISLFFLPVQVFKEFFLEIVPAYSGQTITHIFNQSLIPALLRIIGTDSRLSYDYILIPAVIRIISSSILLLFLSLFCYFNWKYKASSTVFIAGLCSFIPLVTPIGWGYTFVLLYPSFVYLYYRGIMKTKVQWLLYLLCWFGLAIPSYHRIEQYNIPETIKMFYYSRYTIAAILITILLMQRTQDVQEKREKKDVRIVHEKNNKLNTPRVLQA